MEVNRHSLENEYGDLSFFFCCLELSYKFVNLKQYGPILSVEQEIIIQNLNLASNCDFNHGTIIRI